ncbi:MAG: hypothetical protein HRT57_10840 [Crocinitomicaceae bacterium]|nr:hypothetical protein [Crocinitomicaceae bacterium]
MAERGKYYVTISIAIVAAIIVLGFWGYFAYIRPIYLNNTPQTETIDLKKETEFAFGKHIDQGKIYGIEIEMSGDSDSNFDLLISNGIQDVHVASIKGEDIEFIYKNDWNTDSCFLTLLPRGYIGGKVTVECRFLALE